MDTEDRHHSSAVHKLRPTRDLAAQRVTGSSRPQGPLGQPPDVSSMSVSTRTVDYLSPSSHCQGNSEWPDTPWAGAAALVVLTVPGAHGHEASTPPTQRNGLFHFVELLTWGVAHRTVIRRFAHDRVPTHATDEDLLLGHILT